MVSAIKLQLNVLMKPRFRHADLKNDLCKGQIFSVAECVWCRRGNTNQQQIHNTSKEKKRKTIAER